jgi:hypothetical protein
MLFVEPLVLFGFLILRPKARKAIQNTLQQIFSYPLYENQRNKLYKLLPKIGTIFQK